MKLGEITLTSEQEEGVKSLKNGNILMGGVGSGKTFMSIFWAAPQLKDVDHLFVITTAMKRDLIEPGRDKADWQTSLERCGIFDYTVDSWNNIEKYKSIKNSLFLFDEQGASGTGKWAKSFIQIAANNKWIILSATPGDTWLDYIPVFIANGFYRNRSQFIERHIEYDRFVKYPKVKAFHGTAVLEHYRKKIVVPVTVKRHTTRLRDQIFVGHDKERYGRVSRTRFNDEKLEPIATASEYTQLLRKIVSTSPQRADKAYEIMWGTPKIIVFYNYNYERDILRRLCAEIGRPHAEWNGDLHQPVPETDEWIYLMQYTAGNKGPNFTSTDTILFFSPNYSYKVMEQSEGRIDRMNTPYTDLHYYYLLSHSTVDNSVMKAILTKSKFNENGWNKDSRSLPNKDVRVNIPEQDSEVRTKTPVSRYPGY